MTTDPGDTPPRTAEEALARLRAGNLRFVRGEARFSTLQKDVLAELTRGQQPYVTILGCSDSRVPPELVGEGAFKLVGAVYELETGRVRFLD